jgi:predicted benzoate:H+ symporter BenE
VSALGIAIGSSEVDPALQGTENPTLGQQVLTALGALIKWLPAEIIAGYAATVALMQPKAGSAEPANISSTAWWIALIATPVLIGIAGWVAGNYTKLPIKIALSIPAFALWSASVPSSAWNKLDAFRDNSPVFMFGVLIVTIIFTAIAEKVTK